MTVPNHSSRSHAILSASASARWLACTPSARLEAAIPDKRDSIFANEGTLAHEFAELYLRAQVDGLKPDNFELNGLRAQEHYQKEIEEHATDYAKYAAEKITTDDALTRIEMKIDFSGYVPGGFGTGDCVICQEGLLTVVDYKYGKGVKVVAEDNPQLKLYALGALDAYDFAFEFKRFSLCIYQPRLGNISEWNLDRKDLLEWANDTLKPRAKLAAEGAGEFCPGKHCQFCRVKSTCKALANYCESSVFDDFDVENDFSEVMLTDEEYAKLLPKLDVMEKWIHSVKSAALSRMIENPKAIPGFKLVEGRSVRRYGDTEQIVSALKAAGYKEEDFYKPSELIGISDMSKMLGRKQFNALLDGLIVKPAGKPAIVSDSDPRPAFVPERVEDDFNTIEED